MKTLLKDLNWKFAFLTAIIFMSIMVAERGLLMKQARVGMESRLSEKAAFINTFYAFLIADSLQRKDDVTLLQVMNRLEEDPEITSVVVVDNKSEVRYHADSERLGTHWDDPLIQKALETGEGALSPFQNSGGRALALVSPLKVQGMAHPIGAIRIDLTYRHVRDQLSKFDNSFTLAVLGFISTAVGLMLAFVRRWVTLPLETAENAVTRLHLMTAEPNLPESTDEFGRFNKALNEMVLRFRVELQEHMGAGATFPGEFEKDLVERLMNSFLPGAQILIVDKGNRIISRTANGQPVQKGSDHLLDLITDADFANLVGEAYQKEGDLVRGPVHFQSQLHRAAVLCIPENQSYVVKAIIVLQVQS